MKRFSKYHVDISDKGKEDRTYVDYKTGKIVTADSLMEKNFYLENILPNIQNGVITDYAIQKKLNIQPSFKYKGQTIRAIDYVADFWVWFPDGTEKVYDVKGGMVDNVALLKRKLIHYLYPELDYVWVTKLRAGWVDYDEHKTDVKKAKKIAKKEKK